MRKTINLKKAYKRLLASEGLDIQWTCAKVVTGVVRNSQGHVIFLFENFKENGLDAYLKASS